MIKGDSLSLVTPYCQRDTIVFPGENWFFYWKTSASLWKTKIKEAKSFCRGKLFVPIYWAFHTENNETFDFGNIRSETNLSKIVRIAQQENIEIVFLLQLTPFPFLPNGGIPSIFAKHYMKRKSGKICTVIDRENKFQKMYTFFDSSVFQAYSKFIQRLSRYFIDLNLNNAVVGVNAICFRSEEIYSFLEDSSVVFKKTFESYLSNIKKDMIALENVKNMDLCKIKKQQNNNLNQETNIKKIVFSENEIKEYHFDFVNMLSNIYLEEAKKALSNNWEGKISINFLGSSELNFYQNLNQNLTNSSLVSEIVSSIAFHCMPSTILLDVQKNPVFQVASDVVDNQLFYSMLDGAELELFDDDRLTFSPLKFFYLLEDNFSSLSNSSFRQIGLVDYLSQEWGSTYTYRTNHKYIFSEYDSGRPLIYFFQGIHLELKDFYEILKLFMNGGKIILNKANTPAVILKRLEAFIIENKLEVEKIKCETEIHHIKLGEGSITIFHSDSFVNLSRAKIKSFWNKLFSTFKLKHLAIKSTDLKLDYIWMSRPVGVEDDFEYEEVRRLLVYNPSSYVKKIKIEIPDFFSLLKIIDQTHVHIERKAKMIALDMMPGAKIKLDWGVYS